MNTNEIEQQAEVVICWHITESCNYGCGYCDAKWGSNGSEIIHDKKQTRHLLEAVYDFSEKLMRRQAERISSMRLDITGGEPLLCQESTANAISFANELGISVSLTTNASLLTQDLIRDISPDLIELAISLDSFKESTNHLIGRHDRHRRALEIRALVNVISNALLINPKLRLSINTVVSELNWREDMNPVIFHLAPERWCIVKKRNSTSRRPAITDEKFNSFVQRHQALKKIITVPAENLKIQIDPYGRFFAQKLDGSYQFSQPILAIGAESAFSQVAWASHPDLRTESMQKGASHEV